MAQGTRQDNTMAEGLRKLLGDISDLKLAADADLPFLINLETMILGKLKGGASDALQTGQGPPGMGQPGMDPSGGNGLPPGIGLGPGPQPQMMGAMMAPPPGQGSPPGVPGLMQGPNMPNLDELRRVLQRSNTANRLGTVSDRISNAIK